MQSVTTLNLNLQYPNYAVTMHAVQNDKLTRKVVANLFDGSVPFVPSEDAYGMVRFHKPDNTFGFYDVDEDGNTAVTWDGNVATIALAEQALACAGSVLCQIQFYTESGERLTTFTWKIDVEACAMSDEQFLSTDYYSVLSAQISAALSITYRPPYINSNTGHWMIWSVITNQYEDSGYSAAGTQGEQGPAGAYVSSITRISGDGSAGTTDTYQVNLSNGTVAGTFQVYNGADGSYVVSITRVSGTGAAGTTDTYQVNLSDGTVAGTFSVYNGQDGSGAPGSSLPLMDGTASAGSANAYSREDHVHPHDTSKVDVVAGKGLSENDFTDALKDKLDGIESGADVSPTPYTSTPEMDGTGSAGSSSSYARGDHVHPKDTSKQDKNMYFTSKSVTDWYTDNTYTGFGYRGIISSGMQDVRSTMYAEVIFAPTEALSGNYAPVCATYDGGVYIYSKVNTSITVPLIVVQR
jgi:hypothetical protein